MTGCCLLVRRECWEELGGFDEDFFLYYEDVDLCRRARAAGWSVWYEPAVRVTHYRPLHTRPVPAPLRLMTRHAPADLRGQALARRQFALLGWVVWAEPGCGKAWPGSAASGMRPATSPRFGR